MLGASNRQLRVRIPIALLALAPSLLLLLMPAEGRAALEISFYSHEFVSNFPPTFVVLAGTDEGSGQRIDANYGFTATLTGSDILFGAVKRETFSRDWQKDDNISPRKTGISASISKMPAFVRRISHGGKFAAALGATGFNPPTFRSLVPRTDRRR